MYTTQQFAQMIRKETAKMILTRGYGHLGSFSIVEVLALLYNKHMQFDSTNPTWENRDYMILSKGHCSISYYAALALKGFFPVEDLLTFNQDGAYLSAHPSRLKIPGVDSTSGSLGQGLSIASGIALGLKKQNKNNYVYCIVGDGECQEGQIWETFHTLGKHKLSNMIVFIDNNKKQCDGYIDDVNYSIDYSSLESMFDLYYQRVNGHDIEAIDQAINNAKNQKERCSIIVLDTIKGYGVSCFENMPDNHHAKITDSTLRQALEDFINNSKEEL